MYNECGYNPAFTINVVKSGDCWWTRLVWRGYYIPTCTDGIENGNETGVDCGGPDCMACPTCTDGIQNGNETGIDCGGPDCDPCTCSFGIASKTSYSNREAYGATTDGTYYYTLDITDVLEKYDLNGSLVATYSGGYNFNSPQGIVYANEKLYIGDSGNNRIVVVDTNGNYISEFNGGGLNQPRWIYLYNNELYVAQWNGGIIRYDLSGDVISSFNTSGGFQSGMTVYNDEVYVATGQSEIRVYSLSGVLDRIILPTSSYAAGIEIFDNMLIIADHNNLRILVHDLDGNLLQTINEGYGWAMIKEQNQLVRFARDEIEYYSCN